MIKDKYLTTPEAAKLLGFSEDHIRHLIQTGAIKAEKLANRWLIKACAIKGITRQRSRKES